MENSFPVIIAISRISSGSIFLLFSYESNHGHIHNSRGKIPGPCLLMTALRQGYCWEKLDEGHYWGIKLGFQNKKTAYFKMLKLIVKFLSCLGLKTLKTIPHLVAHNCFGQIQYRSQLSKKMQRMQLWVQVYLLHFISPVWQKCSRCCSHTCR